MEQMDDMGDFWGEEVSKNITTGNKIQEKKKEPEKKSGYYIKTKIEKVLKKSGYYTKPKI